MGDRLTGTTSQGCPPPQVYVVPAQPVGWIILAGLLFVLWIRALIIRRRLSNGEPEVSGPEPKEPKVHQGPRFREFAAAMKSMGFKPAEIKARWVQVDQDAPLDAQVAAAVRLGS